MVNRLVADKVLFTRHGRDQFAAIALSEQEKRQVN